MKEKYNKKILNVYKIRFNIKCEMSSSVGEFKNLMVNEHLRGLEIVFFLLCVKRIINSFDKHNSCF